ncbi:hypothetical protein PtA15_6A88 [Puccinia triticina]|uniref:Uncharacterized protein n=1 Tax=Puccinia triticina TaxID=208348 RepID=A0ABY7CNU3_9BASI|nr:uncharacterized protein PtA15_6A88 [Puccinia triticina]WAQ85460.1 hypothetical protein PtA15_6A88 [Puccinia triticina]
MPSTPDKIIMVPPATSALQAASVTPTPISTLLPVTRVDIILARNSTLRLAPTAGLVLLPFSPQVIGSGTWENQTSISSGRKTVCGTRRAVVINGKIKPAWVTSSCRETFSRTNPAVGATWRVELCARMISTQATGRSVEIGAGVTNAAWSAEVARGTMMILSGVDGIVQLAGAH